MSKQIITLSDNAANRIKEIMALAQRESILLGVRVGVKSGGCAGMSICYGICKKSLIQMMKLLKTRE